jgi:rubrerythrin
MRVVESSEEEKMELKGSKTEKNLLAAFAGESQARNRYTYFASAAKKEGYEQISAIFLETAENEREHAKLFFSLLKGGDAEIMAAYPAGVIGNTPDNLKATAAGENLEWTKLYQDFAAIAKTEGLAEAYEAFS